MKPNTFSRGPTVGAPPVHQRSNSQGQAANKEITISRAQRGVRPSLKSQTHKVEGRPGNKLFALAQADVETAETSSKAPEGVPLEAARPIAPERDGADLASPNGERAVPPTTSGQAEVEKDEHVGPKNWNRSNSNGQRKWDDNSRQGSFNRRNRSQGNKRRGPVESFPYKVGDVVIGRVLGGHNGWRIALEEDKDILGFCTTHELPQILRSKIEDEPSWNSTKFGLTRPFKIIYIPPDLEYNGKGPLLSARELDLDILWRRAHQIKQVCDQDGENITVHINKLNQGGCLGSFEGLAVFVPFSQIPRMPDGSIKDRQAVEEMYVGKEVEVSIIDVQRNANRFVGNMIKAMHNKAFYNLKVGDICWGTVNAIESYGAFISLEQHPSVRGLLHIGAISREHVQTMRDFFHVGEKVRSLVVGIDTRTSRVSLSTAELEPESGDMLYNKAKVYQNAEQNVADFKQWMVQRQKEIESGEYSPEGKDDALDWNA